jgi:hypothetical protein
VIAIGEKMLRKNNKRFILYTISKVALYGKYLVDWELFWHTENIENLQTKKGCLMGLKNQTFGLLIFSILGNFMQAAENPETKKLGCSARRPLGAFDLHIASREVQFREPSLCSPTECRSATRWYLALINKALALSKNAQVTSQTFQALCHELKDYKQEHARILAHNLLLQDGDDLTDPWGKLIDQVKCVASVHTLPVEWVPSRDLQNSPVNLLALRHVSTVEEFVQLDSPASSVKSYESSSSSGHYPGASPKHNPQSFANTLSILDRLPSVKIGDI